jgi:hypothetical protein
MLSVVREERQGCVKFEMSAVCAAVVRSLFQLTERVGCVVCAGGDSGVAEPPRHDCAPLTVVCVGNLCMFPGVVCFCGVD